jgi:predicted metal-dependent hydrolase
MLRPVRFEHEYGAGPVQIQARKVHFDVSDVPLHSVLNRVDFIFSRTLAPSTSPHPKRRLSQLCDRLWLIAAVEHYTAVIGDFVLNCRWPDYAADPDVFRRHGSEEVEQDNVADDVAAYFHNSYPDRVRPMLMAVAMAFVFFQRGTRGQQKDSGSSWTCRRSLAGLR